MKRSNVIILTLAGVGLAATRCHRQPTAHTPAYVHSTAVLPPTSLSPEMRASLPAFAPGQDVSSQVTPHNAYDPQLGYYHQPCSSWFPYPYDYYDSRWGYYRCGQWSRYHSTQAYSSSSSFYRPGMGYFGGSGFRPSTPVPTGGDYTSQPVGAPVHTGVSRSSATATHAAFSSSSTSRGGFGSTGHFSGFFSGS